MRRTAATIVLVVVFVLALRSTALAQSPAASPVPVTSPAAVVEDQGDDGDDRPWGRLLVFVPVSALIGAGAVFGRRAARDRGWIRS